jgi:hypothetical protein
LGVELLLVLDAAALDELDELELPELPHALIATAAITASRPTRLLL